MPASERVVVLMPPEDKAKLEDKARRWGMSVGELVRRSVRAYEPDDQLAAVESLLAALDHTNREAMAALADAERELAATERYFAERRARGEHH